MFERANQMLLLLLFFFKSCESVDRFEVTSDYQQTISGVVHGGGCTTSGACFQSPNYPDDYGKRQYCTIKVSRVKDSEKLFPERFYTQGSGDKLTIGGAEYSQTTSPNGVVVSAKDEIKWASDGSTTYGGAGSSGYGFKICFVEECAQKNGKIINTGSPTCGCGGTICDATSGMFCLADGNRCSPNAIQVCTTTDGSKANLNDCVCGLASCSAETGRKCVASLNECSLSQCSETDGTRTNSNSESCVCGDGSDTRSGVNNKSPGRTTGYADILKSGKGAICSTATGFFCTASINTCSLYAPCEASKWSLTGDWNELTASCTLRAKIQIGSGQILKIRKHPSVTTEVVVDRSGKGILTGLLGADGKFFDVGTGSALYVEGLTLTGAYYTGPGGVVRVFLFCFHIIIILF